METLKDIKEVLEKIPDKELEGLFFGIGENNENTIGLIALESEKVLGYPDVFRKYPDLEKIDKLVRNIRKAQDILESQEIAEELSEDLQQEGITDTYFDKKTD